MREQVKNILGGHFRPSAPCCYVEGFAQTSFQGQQAAAADPAAVAFVSRRARPGSAGGREFAPQRGRAPSRRAASCQRCSLEKCRIRSARTTDRQMGNFVESRVVAGTPPIGSGWAAPAPVAGDRLAEAWRPALGQREACTAEFVREVGRAVAPAGGPRVATINPESRPTPHHNADRGLCVLPTYLRHPEVSA